MPDQPLSFDLHNNEPILVVISGPSGVGKDTVVKALLEREDLSLHFVVTMTSRDPRPGEVNGKDYFFVSREAFEGMIQRDELLEYAKVYLDYKGIPKAQIREAMNSHKDILLRVNVQGAKTLRKICPEALMIFLMPSSREEWMDFLENRKTENEESLTSRVDEIQYELSQVPEFDYVVVNAKDQLDKTVNIIASIIIAEHHRVNPRKVKL